MNKEFLDKVCDQIISETRIDDDKLYTPFFSFFFVFFYSHCRDVYSLNKEETEYVWIKYKEGIRTLIDKKELIHKEKKDKSYYTKNFISNVDIYM